MPKEMPERPCLDYYIKRCKAPCILAQSQDEYRAMIDEVLIFLDGNAREVKGACDFVGLNVYTPNYVRADESSPLGFAVEPNPSSYPHMYSPWLTLGPECIYWAVRNTCDVWKEKAPASSPPPSK